MKRMYKGNFFHALRTKPLYQIKLSADTSVESMFNDVLMSTYGKHVFDAYLINILSFLLIVILWYR